MKNKDAKDKEKLSRHQFVPGTFAGVLQCSGCDKTLLGKESLQCASKSLGPVCNVSSPHPVSSPRVKLLLTRYTNLLVRASRTLELSALRWSVLVVRYSLSAVDDFLKSGPVTLTVGWMSPLGCLTAF